MTTYVQPEWEESFVDPSCSRISKPRQQGLTMVIDKGIGLNQFSDTLQMAEKHIDFIKLGFGTSVLYPHTLLQGKINMADRYAVALYPGGSFFEVAFLQGKLEAYFEALLAWGFRTVEISDGTISLPARARKEAIKKACSYGFTVLTECGKKVTGSKIELQEMKETLLHDLEAGANYMIIEGRESGKDVGLFDSEGGLNHQELFNIRYNLGEELLPYLIWEAPQKQQQVEFIKQFGADVNLGNIAPDDIYSVEALRRGLRADTLLFCNQMQPKHVESLQ